MLKHKIVPNSLPTNINFFLFPSAMQHSFWFNTYNGESNKYCMFFITSNMRKN